ncbi:hypothetical protein BH11PSE9_BH11PSE9_38740 [soil metagenome]
MKSKLRIAIEWAVFAAAVAGVWIVVPYRDHRGEMAPPSGAPQQPHATAPTPSR